VFEYHGWVTIRESPGAEEDEDALRELVEGVRGRVAELGSPYLADVRWMNGSAFLHLGGSPNHRETHGDQVIGLLRDVGRRAPGSYGLLYVHDDEDDRLGNEFRVFRLVRGQVTEHADRLLSPVVPVVEDP
jgi:hypothetical protein